MTACTDLVYKSMHDESFRNACEKAHISFQISLTARTSTALDI